MLKVKIFDVGHGNCAYIVTPNNHTILVDAGHDADADVVPCREIVEHHKLIDKTSLTLFINSNADNDHVSHLEEVFESLPPRFMEKNPTINSAVIRRVKTDGMSPGLETLCDMCDIYTTPMELPDLGGVTLKHFSLPMDAVDDKTNNASVISFVYYGNFCILFPGDMEKKGWEMLMERNPEFVKCLRDVRVFVASHHGRDGGYCAELFGEGVCQPDVFVISDKEIEYGTQEHDHYGPHARGLVLDRISRNVLTTRKHGDISFEVDDSGRLTVLLGKDATVIAEREPAF